jgi:hypothetical protein
MLDAAQASSQKVSEDSDVAQSLVSIQLLSALSWLRPI